ncbi:hypothetical protein EDD86DRAFT_57156 [Gorgonomyces haynaldii]|nr:hypothetical protein EDD86DRAFT_57156 [Gorgonomyces haynaldii]
MAKAAFKKSRHFPRMQPLSTDKLVSLSLSCVSLGLSALMVVYLVMAESKNRRFLILTFLQFLNMSTQSCSIIYHIELSGTAFLVLQFMISVNALVVNLINIQTLQLFSVLDVRLNSAFFKHAYLTCGALFLILTPLQLISAFLPTIVLRQIATVLGIIWNALSLAYDNYQAYFIFYLIYRKNVKKETHACMYLRTAVFSNFFLNGIDWVGVVCMVLFVYFSQTGIVFMDSLICVAAALSGYHCVFVVANYFVLVKSALYKAKRAKSAKPLAKKPSAVSESVATPSEMPTVLEPR